MTFICFEGLRYVPRKEKITSSTRDSYCIFGGRSGVANFINLLSAMCLSMKLNMND